MNKPLFSILMANYNGEGFIQYALDSVLKQSYDNYEVIIVDDGSTDNSRLYLESLYSNPKFHIFYNDCNHGCGYTKRICVEKAHGDICGFLDVDDALTDDAIETMVNAHVDNPDKSLIYSRYYLCDNNMDVRYVSQHQCAIPPESSFLEYKRGAISHFVTFKKSSYKKTSGICPNFRIAEDVDLYFKLEEVGGTLFIDKPLYYYRSGTGMNTSLDENVSIAAVWEIIAKTDALRRRGINLETRGLPLIEEIVDSIAGRKMESSREYKMGKYLLHPQELFKRIKRKKR